MFTQLMNYRFVLFKRPCNNTQQMNVCRIDIDLIIYSNPHVASHFFPFPIFLVTPVAKVAVL